MMIDNGKSLPVSPSEEETAKLLKSCARMMGFEYDPNDSKEKQRKEFCKKHGITEEEYESQIKLNKYLKKEKNILNPYKSMELGSDF